MMSTTDKQEQEMLAVSFKFAGAILFVGTCRVDSAGILLHEKVEQWWFPNNIICEDDKLYAPFCLFLAKWHAHRGQREPGV